jgi:hypothetical protein
MHAKLFLINSLSIHPFIHSLIHSSIPLMDWGLIQWLSEGWMKICFLSTLYPSIHLFIHSAGVCWIRQEHCLVACFVAMALTPSLRHPHNNNVLKLQGLSSVSPLLETKMAPERQTETEREGKKNWATT